MTSWFSRRSIRTQILLLAVAIMLPVAAMLGWFLTASLQQARTDAHEKVRLLANNTALNLDRYLRQNEDLMGRLATRPLVRALNPNACDPLLAELVRLHPDFLTMGLADRHANVVCTFLANPPSTAQIARSHWFTEGLHNDKFTAGNAVFAQPTQRWTSVQTYPVRDDKGEVSGLFVMPVDLLKLSEDILGGVPRNAIVTVRDRNGRILLRSADAASFIGQAGPVKAGEATQGMREGFVRTTGLDGVPRVFGFVTVAGVEWRVLAGLPEKEVFADYDTLLRRSVATGFALFLVALALAWRIGAAIIKPIAGLAGTAASIAAGDHAARVKVSGPREVESVGRQFNLMLDTRDRHEEALRQSEENLAITLQSIGDAVIATDTAGRITRMNPTAERLTGWPLSDAAGQPLAEVFHIINAQTRLPAINPVQRVMQHGQVVGLANHTALLSRDGKEYQISDSAAPIRNAAGEIVGVVLVFSDVTESYRVRQALDTTAELLERTGEVAKVGGWEIDLRTMQLFWSRETFHIHEVDAQETPTLDNAILFYTPDVRPVIQSAVQATMSQGMPFDLELTMITAKGRHIWVRAQGTPVVEDDKAVRLVGALHDITERKQAEQALRIAAIAFESQQGMFVTDADWVILQVNTAFTEISGYSADEAVGQTPATLLRSGRHDVAFFAAMTESIQQTGTWQGEVWDQRKNGEVYPQWLTVTAVKNEAGLITHYVDAFTDISARKAAEDQIQKLAFFDPLTGLPNRRLLQERLKQSMAAGARRQNKGALLFVDLDNFKTLNDTLGHDTGDLLLQQVAGRLSACVREGDTVARLGGDEFVVMLENLSESPMEAAAQAEHVGEKIRASLNEIYLLGSYAHHSTPSIGVTLFGEAHEEIEEALKRADLAMYQAKAAGRNTLRFFDPEMQALVTARAALETGLREGLAHDEFVLFYQAQVTRQDDGTNRMTGVEALVRWRPPQRELVSPAEFIPLSEDTGLILLLGKWVLQTACTQLANWAHSPEMAHLTMAVNVSPHQFHQVDFVAQVLTILAGTGANPRQLKLELTEGMLVANVEGVIEKMTALKSQGVGFSLDDFGTGYSSLAHLKRLPLDQLKIDQGFVRDVLTDPNDAAIARMVIALGDSLGLSVIAEGVETEAQREFLAAQGCHAYQGYLFGRPLPVEELEAFVKLA